MAKIKINLSIIANRNLYIFLYISVFYNFHINLFANIHFRFSDLKGLGMEKEMDVSTKSSLHSQENEECATDTKRLKVQITEEDLVRFINFYQFISSYRFF